MNYTQYYWIACVHVHITAAGVAATFRLCLKRGVCVHRWPEVVCRDAEQAAERRRRASVVSQFWTHRGVHHTTRPDRKQQRSISTCTLWDKTAPFCFYNNFVEAFYSEMLICTHIL